MDARREFFIAIQGNDARVDGKSPVHAHIEIENAEFPHVVTPRSRSRHIDRSVGIYFPECGEAARMVAVAMGEDGEIDGLEVAAEQGCVL